MGDLNAMNLTGRFTTATALQNMQAHEKNAEHDCSQHKMLNKLVQGSYADSLKSDMADYYFGGNYE